MNKNIFNNFTNRWKTSEGLKPIGSYSYFLYNFIIKKKSTIVIPIVSFILVFFFTLIPSFFNSQGIDKTLTSTLLQFSVVLSVFMTMLYSVNKTINIFKDCQNEGVELIIVSKPIERWQILTTKFIFSFIFIIIISMLNFISFSISASFSWFKVYGSTINFGKIIGLFLVSNLFVGIFFFGITTLFAIKFGKKLASSFPIILFSVLYVLSSVVSSISLFVSNNKVKSFSDNLNKQNTNIGVKIVEENLNNNPSYIFYKDSFPIYKNSNLNIVEEYGINDINFDFAWSDSDNGDWYKFLKWINPTQSMTSIVTDNLGSTIFSGSVIFLNDSTIEINPDYQYLNDNTLLYEDKSKQYYILRENWNEIPIIASNEQNGILDKTLFKVTNLNSSTDKISISSTYFSDNSPTPYNIEQLLDIYLNNKQVLKDIDLFWKQENNKFNNNINLFWKQQNNKFDNNKVNLEVDKLIKKYNDISIPIEIPINNEPNQNKYINTKKFLMTLSMYIYLYSNWNKFRDIFQELVSNNVDNQFKISFEIEYGYGYTQKAKFETNLFNDQLNSGIGQTNYSLLSTKNTKDVFVVKRGQNAVPTYGVILLWFGISVTIICTSAIIYFRRDFK